jgi:hypothetical protein
VTPASSQPEDPSSLPSPTEPSPTTLTGTVTAGVEANCLLLDGYLLIGGDPAVVRAGARVIVHGRVDRDLMTTCQQGTPFVVDSATTA